MDHRRFLSIPGAAAVLMTACSFGGGGTRIPVSQRKDASSVAWVEADGARHTLAEHRGKVVLVDVWATWCPPCRKSLPEVAELQRKGGAEYVVLALSVDAKGWQIVKPFLAQHPELGLQAGIPDGTKGLEPFGSIPAIPTTLVIDRQGRIRQRWAGYINGQAKKALSEALAEPN